VASTLFFVGGAVFVLLAALYMSYGIWPVFTPGLSMTGEAPLVILGSADDMLRTTVIISAPVIMVMFLATLGLGLVNRTAPQLNVFFLSMPVKSALGIAFLIIYLPFVLDMLMYTSEDSILVPVKKLIAR
jgi:type III secretion protein T